MAFYYAWENPVMAGPTAEYARVAKVSPEFFRVFDVNPILGDSSATRRQSRAATAR
jgi:hypothetical protein